MDPAELFGLLARLTQNTKDLAIKSELVDPPGVAI